MRASHCRQSNGHSWQFQEKYTAVICQSTDLPLLHAISFSLTVSIVDYWWLLSTLTALTLLLTQYRSELGYILISKYLGGTRTEVGAMFGAQWSESTHTHSLLQHIWSSCLLFYCFRQLTWLSKQLPKSTRFELDYLRVKTFYPYESFMRLICYSLKN